MVVWHQDSNGISSDSAECHDTEDPHELVERWNGVGAN